MKQHMNSQVESNLDMFAESCDEVKKRLVKMCREVEEAVANRADEVFVNMFRDYMEVISGNKVKGQMMEKGEWQMRAEVAKLIESRNKANVEADEADEREKYEAMKASKMIDYDEDLAQLPQAKSTIHDEGFASTVTSLSGADP